MTPNPLELVPVVDVPGFELSRGTTVTNGYVWGIVVESLGDDTILVSWGGANNALPEPICDLLLDMGDPSTRDKATRWLGGRLGLPSGCTAPGWCPAAGTTRPIWWLIDAYSRESREFSPWESADVVVPKLANLDGTGGMDNVALALACTTVGRRT